jgi:hypothetical protein
MDTANWKTRNISSILPRLFTEAMQIASAVRSRLKFPEPTPCNARLQLLDQVG